MKRLSSCGRLARTMLTVAGLAVLSVACAGTEAPVDVEQPPVVDEPGEAAEPEDAEAPADNAPEQPEGPVGEDCSAQGAQIVAPALTGIPDEVVAMRDFLLDAALRCDEQLLFTAIQESDLFTYSFGGGDDAIGYWWDLEEAGEQPFLRLAQVLATTPAIADGGEVVVWPQVTTGRDEHTTEAAWAELTWLTDQELIAYQGEVGYLGWRAGVSIDGQWRFFVAGD